MDTLKLIASAVWAYILESVAPVGFLFYLLIITMLLDTLVGYKAGKKEHGEGFKIDKAFRAVKRLILYLALILLMHRYFSLTGEASLASKAADLSSGWVLYWFVLNIIKNACIIYPKDQSFKALYKVVSVDIVNIFKTKWKQK